MKIGLRGGHSKYCIGAVGKVREYEECQGLFKAVKTQLEKAGHTVIDCNSNASSQSQELREGVNKANANRCDLFLSLHMNAFGGSAHGTEAWIYNAGTKTVAQRLVNNFATLGLYNRGVKYSQGYYELKYTNMGAIIFETLFCDSEKDVAIWNKTSWEKLGRLIANAIDTKISIEAEAPKPTPPPTTTSCDKEVKRYGEKGKCTITASAIIFRDKPCTCHGVKQGTYSKNESVFYDLVVITERYVWISWISASTGARRYMPIKDKKTGERWGNCV